jgi:hypothetical protein
MRAARRSRYRALKVALAGVVMIAIGMSVATSVRAAGSKIAWSPVTEIAGAPGGGGVFHSQLQPRR